MTALDFSRKLTTKFSMIAISDDGPLNWSPQQNLHDEAVKPGDCIGCTSGVGTYVWRHDGDRLTWLSGDTPRFAARTPNGGWEYMLDPDRHLKENVLNLPGVAEDAVLHKMRLEPGQFFPRIARPTIEPQLKPPGYLPNAPECSSPMLGTLNQLRTLVDLLERILGSVHPTDENLKCYGTNIRNLLILASTECEAQWKGVLNANGYVAQHRSNRGDYRKLDEFMKLSEYKIGLAHYPWLSTTAPFQEFMEPRASDWYDNYNSVKHDRENSFSKASLKSAIEAVCATWVMAIAQFGFHAMNGFSDLREYFRFDYGPSWRFSDVYYPGDRATGWHEARAFEG